MNDYKVRNAQPDEFKSIGQLLVEVYSNLQGFPNQDEQPNYYEKLANVGSFTQHPGTELLVAVSGKGSIDGAVIYFQQMRYYGAGGIATEEQNASGFRLLAVNPSARGKGIGKLLSEACIAKAKTHSNKQLIIHTTNAMQTAWKMYESIGFKRSHDLDFLMNDFPVFGFRLVL